MAFREVVRRLQPLARAFDLSGAAIRILPSPKSFYEHLLQGVEEASSRVRIASLYLGSGSHETRFLKRCEQALALNPQLSISLVFDRLRAMRGNQHLRMFPSLLGQFPDRMQVSLFACPQSIHPIVSMAPERYREVFGVQHMKIYVFDDTVLLSGANMSDSYFENRQDRYVLIHGCKDLADFWAGIVDGVANCSEIMPSRSTSGTRQTPHEGGGSFSLWAPSAKDFDALRNFLKDAFGTPGTSLQSASQPPPASATTIGFATCQMGPLGITQDELLLDELLDVFGKMSAETVLSTAYLNLTDALRDKILRPTASPLTVITSAPEANSFFGSKGFSRYIPQAYSYLEHQFCRRAAALQQTHRLTTLEYARPGWTFHGKGMWFFGRCPGAPSTAASTPTDTISATTIGSSNFGVRSVERDLEAQLVLVSQDAGLAGALQAEVGALRGHCHPVDPLASHPPFERWVPMATELVKPYL